MLPAFEFPELDFKSNPKPMSLSDLEGCDLALYVVNGTDTTDVLSAMPHGNVLKAMREHMEEDALLDAVLPNRHHTRVLVASIDPGQPAIKLLEEARKWVKAAARYRYPRLDINLSAFDAKGGARVAEAVLSAVAISVAPTPSFKRKKPPTPALRSVRLHGCKFELDVDTILATAEGTGLARYLSMAPANAITPETFRSHVEELANEAGWRYTFVNLEQLQQMNCGAFEAVAKGAPEIDSGILHLTYTPERNGDEGLLALVGKGLCMDTGGYNLKTGGSMLGMHLDMTGGAVALGTLLALTRMQVPFRVDCWLALTENHISPAAYRNNDVITAADGTTIEIIDTDAEGRMVLADTLLLAGGEQPALIIDYATLTGACVRALGTRMSGVFTNQASLLGPLAEHGNACGERVWGFPLHEDYEQNIKSDIADVKQCAPGVSTDHMDAAAFLKRFVPESVSWLHMDLSAAQNKGGLGHVDTDVTGFGVRYTVSGLAESGVLRRLLNGQ